MRRAFSLIELLVVISIIALLIGILLPSLSTSRRVARATVGFANLRSVGTMLHTYVNDNRETFLNPFRRAWPDTPPFQNMTWTMACSTADPSLRWDFRALIDCYHTESFGTVWYSFLAEARGGHRADMEALSPADSDLVSHYKQVLADSSQPTDATLMPTSFIYPPTFFLNAGRFAAGGRTSVTPDTLRSAELSGVYAPSAKVMLFERMDFATARAPLAYNSVKAKTHVMLVDGSADTVDMGVLFQRASEVSDLIPLFTTCETPPPDAPLPFFWGTFQGIKGRDLDR